MADKKARRERGRILTESGWKKLDAALQAWEILPGNKRTFERISHAADLDPGTVAKILKRKDGADLSKLERLFSAFQLTLGDEDHGAVPQTAAQADPNFVGREEAIADLTTLISRDARVIVIQARGGVGKTTLARKYLQQEFDSVLEFPIAKETKDIASIESLIEEKLRQLGEEPGREFLVSIDRLKRKLQRDRIGILIDNLEPALDSAGKFIEPHRRYVELLRVLADPSVQSVTLITSRERLNEYSVSVQHYLLGELSLAAWTQFFQNRFAFSPPENPNFSDEDLTALANLHNAYGGNAKAMDILCGAILTDYSGNITAYWHANQNDLLIERALEDLVVSQFDRLQQLDPDAYNLLCRMGCYRYQDVPTVPLEGLLCLLWDVPENRQRRVVKALQERSLVDSKENEYWLHPVIRAESRMRLQRGEDWNRANREAANFLENFSEEIDNISKVLFAFEPYYHYVDINEFECASEIITRKQIDSGEPSTGDLLFHKGSPVKVISAIERIEKDLNPGSTLIKLHDLLGHLYAMQGDYKKAIAYHEKTKESSSEKSTYYVFSLFNLGFRKIELWELEQALSLIKEAHLLSYELSLRKRSFYKYKVLAQCYLSFLEAISCNFSESKNLALNAYSEIFKVKLTIWNLGYGLIFLGLAFKKLGEFHLANECYKKSLEISLQHQYPRLEACTLFHVSAIYNEFPDFRPPDYTNINNYQQRTIEILDRIGAKGDLAQALYHFGLIYQSRNETLKSKKNFIEAIRLFTEMEAPRQVERVKRSMGDLD